MTTSRRGHKRVLDCYDLVAKEVLINGMFEDYRIFWESLSFPSFSRLKEATRRMKGSVHTLRVQFNSQTSVKQEAYGCDL